MDKKSQADSTKLTGDENDQPATAADQTDTEDKGTINNDERARPGFVCGLPC